MVMVGRPLNVSGWPPTLIASSWSRRATWAAPIVMGAVPNALLKTTRALDPPRLVWTTCRSV
jgi:hypothetical protein